VEKIEFVQRRGTSCKKWDRQQEMFSRDGLTGLWVADMDFKAPECVRNALKEAVEFGVFGYVYPRDSYFQAIIDWEARYHGYHIRKEWIHFSPGVVPAFNWMIQILSQPGDAIIVQTPVYYPVLEAVQNNERTLVKSKLVVKDGRYAVDYADFEAKIAQNHVKAFILCSPHNPVGRVWEPEELRRMLEICKHYGVYVISDEIHQDLTFGNHKHTPCALLGDYDDILVTLLAPSKTFNLAGLQNSAVVIPNPEIRARFNKFSKAIRIFYGNMLGYIAAEAAYKDGRPWLEAVKSIIAENDRYVRNAFGSRMPGVFIPELEGTYLLWMDFSAYLKPEQMVDFFENRCNLALDYGNWFGGDDNCSVRMNLATSPEIIHKAVETILDEYAKLAMAD